MNINLPYPPKLWTALLDHIQVIRNTLTISFDSDSADWAEMLTEEILSDVDVFISTFSPLTDPASNCQIELDEVKLEQVTCATSTLRIHIAENILGDISTEDIPEIMIETPDVLTHEQKQGAALFFFLCELQEILVTHFK